MFYVYLPFTLYGSFREQRLVAIESRHSFFASFKYTRPSLTVKYFPSSMAKYIDWLFRPTPLVCEHSVMVPAIHNIVLLTLIGYLCHLDDHQPLSIRRQVPASVCLELFPCRQVLFFDEYSVSTV